MMKSRKSFVVAVALAAAAVIAVVAVLSVSLVRGVNDLPAAISGGVAPPTELAVAADGQYTTGIRMQWRWTKTVDKYELQTAETPAFAPATTTPVTRSAAAPAGGLQALTVKSLKPASTYYVRARSIAGKATSSWSPVVATSTAIPWPDAITAMVARPGPEVGQLTVDWTAGGAYTTSFRIDTGLSIFSRTDPALPETGRNAASFSVPATARSFTFGADELATAGAPLGSANHLYLRVYAVVEGTAGNRERAFPQLRSSDVRGKAPDPGLAMKVGSFNVRTAGAGDPAPFDWPSRAPYVAKELLARHPGLVSLQELSPGPQDGKDSPTRQTDSLLDQLAAGGGRSYQLVRRTSYIQSGTVTGSQGMRILYDTDRYTLLDDCPETTEVDGKTKGFSRSCSFSLPLRDGDSESFRRSAAFAHFQDKATKTPFWFVAIHLDHRVGTTTEETQSYETLRGRQVQTITAKMDELNSAGEPIIIAGDINSYQNTPTDYAPHNALIDAGYYDTAAAVNPVKFSYNTVNKFDTEVSPSSSGFGARLDKILVKGATGSSRFENVVEPVDPRRASDHNLVIADFTIPQK